MKNMGILLITLLSLSTLTYGQKTVITTTYTTVCETCKELRLTELSLFEKKLTYSHINSDLIVDMFFIKKDTEITYYLVSADDKELYYGLMLRPKSKKNFVKKYGKIYIVKRKTPKLN